MPLPITCVYSAFVTNGSNICIYLTSNTSRPSLYPESNIIIRMFSPLIFDGRSFMRVIIFFFNLVVKGFLYTVEVVKSPNVLFLFTMSCRKSNLFEYTREKSLAISDEATILAP